MKLTQERSPAGIDAAKPLRGTFTTTPQICELRCRAQRPTKQLGGIDAPGAKLSESEHAGQATSLLLSQFNQRLRRVPGLGHPQANTPSLCISAVSLRTSFQESWRRRCLQVSALESTTFEVNLGLRSQNIFAATSATSWAWPVPENLTVILCEMARHSTITIFQKMN